MAAHSIPVDSLDLFDGLTGIENAAGIRFADDAFDFDHEVNVGEFFDALWSRLPDRVKRNGKCPTLMMFMVIRSWCVDRGYVIRPDTRLSDLRDFDYIRLRRDLRRAGWAMPDAPIGGIRFFGASLAAAMVGYVLLPFGGWALFGALATFVGVLCAAFCLDLKSDFQKHWTVAELIRQIAYKNLKRLRLDGGSLHRKLLWDYIEDGCGDGKQPLQREAPII